MMVQQEEPGAAVPACHSAHSKVMEIQREPPVVVQQQTVILALACVCLTAACASVMAQ